MVSTEIQKSFLGKEIAMSNYAKLIPRAPVCQVLLPNVFLKLNKELDLKLLYFLSQVHY